MSEDIKKFLYQLLNRIDGLYSVVISDKEGVPIIKVSTEKAPELATRPQFLSIFGVVFDQSRKLNLGKSESVTCLYSNYQVIQINELPMVVTFIADINANTGYIHTVEKHLSELLTSLSDIFD